MLDISFTPFPHLCFQDIVLRQILIEDVNEVFLLRSNPVSMQYIDRPLVLSLDDAEKLLRQWCDLLLNNEAITWAICREDRAKMFGTICFWNIQKENYRAEVGYMLLPEYFNKGIMTQVLKVVLEYGFNTLKLHSVEAHINYANAASKRLLEKVGFKQEAYFRENYFYNGKFLDTAVYSILSQNKLFNTL